MGVFMYYSKSGWILGSKNSFLAAAAKHLPIGDVLHFEVNKHVSVLGAELFTNTNSTPHLGSEHFASYSTGVKTACGYAHIAGNKTSKGNPFTSERVGHIAREALGSRESTLVGPYIFEQETNKIPHRVGHPNAVLDSREHLLASINEKPQSFVEYRNVGGGYRAVATPNASNESHIAHMYGKAIDQGGRDTIDNIVAGYEQNGYNDPAKTLKELLADAKTGTFDPLSNIIVYDSSGKSFSLDKLSELDRLNLLSGIRWVGANSVGGDAAYTTLLSSFKNLT